VTEYGRWLRGTSIDELPQLINVLKGEMSLVGPRPEMRFIAEAYDDWQRRRLSVKPGITGLWQILGRKDLPMHENLQYDFYYIRNRSLSLDLSILLRTIGAVLSRKGAF
jgi:lipopolysaccharide/colanic/teichoic acid biosynthesis glycosyltransferase